MAGGDDTDVVWDYAQPESVPLVGIKALMIAILDDAVRAYLGPSDRGHEEAWTWMAQSRSQWVFSFSVVCETLQLDASAVRSAVVKLRAQSTVPSRSRLNAQRQGALRIR